MEGSCATSRQQASESTAPTRATGTAVHQRRSLQRPPSGREQIDCGSLAGAPPDTDEQAVRGSTVPVLLVPLVPLGSGVQVLRRSRREVDRVSDRRLLAATRSDGREYISPRVGGRLKRD